MQVARVPTAQAQLEAGRDAVYQETLDTLPRAIVDYVQAYATVGWTARLMPHLTTLVQTLFHLYQSNKRVQTPMDYDQILGPAQMQDTSIQEWHHRVVAALNGVVLPRLYQAAPRSQVAVMVFEFARHMAAVRRIMSFSVSELGQRKRALLDDVNGQLALASRLVQRFSTDLHGLVRSQLGTEAQQLTLLRSFLSAVLQPLQYALNHLGAHVSTGPLFVVQPLPASINDERRADPFLELALMTRHLWEWSVQSHPSTTLFGAVRQWVVLAEHWTWGHRLLARGRQYLQTPPGKREVDEDTTETQTQLLLGPDADALMELSRALDVSALEDWVVQHMIYRPGGAALPNHTLS